MLNIFDRVPLDQDAQIRLTGDGYMVAMPRVARTGIQLYRGKEVGMPQMDVVRVFRPEDQVFHKDSMATYVYKPITNDHPAQPVTAKNWRDHSVGNSGETVARDGEFIRVPMLLMDARTIQDVKDGKAELSVGYSTELKWEKGTDPKTGEAYDAVQTDIRVNHIAIVDAARGGDKLKIGDKTAPGPSQSEAGAAATTTGDDAMTEIKTTTLTVDGISLVMPELAAQVVHRTLGSLNDKLNAATAQLTTLTTAADKAKVEFDALVAKMQTEHKTALDAKQAEVDTLKKQVGDATLTPEKIEALVKDRAEMIGKAHAVLGDKLVTTGKSDEDIRRQVVDAKMGDAAKGWSPEQVKISFDTITTGVKYTAPGVTDTARAFQQPPQHTAGTGWTQDQKNAAYAKRDQTLQNAWQNGGKAA